MDFFGLSFFNTLYNKFAHAPFPLSIAASNGVLPSLSRSLIATPLCNTKTLKDTNVHVDIGG